MTEFGVTDLRVKELRECVCMEKLCVTTLRVKELCVTKLRVKELCVKELRVHACHTKAR